ncbi:MAG: secondary thiamine-phosphate synthase enzyme YjbQ [Halanaerobiaceae bacterium]
MLEELNVSTSDRVELIDITGEIRQIISNSGIQQGTAVVFVPHTTAGITINEDADPDVVKDIVREINKVIPFNDNYSHLEGNSAAHIKSSLFGASETVIIDNGRPILGRWQGIYFCEFDGGRHRKVYVKICEGQ